MAQLSSSTVFGDLTVTNNINIFGSLNSTSINIGGVRKDENWDIAYTHSQTAHAPSNANYYVHPSVNHIPTGGAAGNILQWSSSGTAAWKANGTTSQYLRGDGNWSTPPNDNTASAVDNILSGSNSGTAITYQPYTTSQAATGNRFYTHNTMPTATTLLNLSSHLRITQGTIGTTLTVNGDIIGNGKVIARTTDGWLRLNPTYTSSPPATAFHSGVLIPSALSVSGNVGIGTTSPSEKLEVGGNIRLVGAGGTGDGSLEIWRGTNASWKLLNTGGILKFQSNYTSSVGSYYDAMTLDYNTGNLWFKGQLTGGTVPVARVSGLHACATSGVASSATTLATARTINGTSFNGSANITTANWGTARTITIGNTGKSVNGSANVSWSLEEIGVVSNHTLDLTSLNQDTYYPVTIKVPYNNFVRMRILNALNQGSPHPSWATHASGFSALLEWSVQGSGWGTSQITRYISRHTESHVSGKAAIGGITQMTNSSNEVVWLRGGGKYFFEADRDVTPVVRTSAYTTSNQTVTPQTDVINVPSEQGLGYFGVGVLVGSVAGNATTATTLATARTINGTSFNGSANITTANWGTARTLTIGSTGKSVNGSGNVSWTLAEIGAAPTSHTHTANQISGSYLQLSGRSTSWGSTDGTSTGAVNVIMGTSSGATWLISGTSNGTFRGGIQLLDSGGTMRLYTNTSYLTISGSTVTGSLEGNASTATKLATARTINGTSFDGSANITTANWGTARTLTIGSTGKSVNGSANVSWSLAEIGAAPASHTHSYLPLSGGTLSGVLKVSQEMTAGTTAAFTNPHLALASTNNADETGFVGMTFATSTSENYGFSLGALRSTSGNGSMVLRFHSSSAAGTEVARITHTGDLTATRIYNAVYNDYAEYFLKDEQEIEPGDIIIKNPDGDGFIKSQKAKSNLVVGVMSTNYAQCIGGDKNVPVEEQEEKYAPVGLAGRLPVKVVGRVELGDLIVSSEIPGVGMASKEYIPGTVVGKALESYDSDEVGKIEMLIMNI